MLSVFPIMFLSLLAHAILRVFVGGILLYLGYRHLRKHRAVLGAHFRTHWPHIGLPSVILLGTAECVLGFMFIAGFLTQIAAIGGMILSLQALMFRRSLIIPALPDAYFWILLLAASTSLLITGAGALAIDLPI